MHHIKAVVEFKLELQFGSSQFESESPISFSGVILKFEDMDLLGRSALMYAELDKSVEQ